MKYVEVLNSKSLISSCPYKNQNTNNTKPYKTRFLNKSMEKDIGRIKKNDMSDIVVRIDDFGGRKGLTIREFITSDRYTGFTKSGVKIPASDFGKFKEMINSISDRDMKQEPEEDKGEELPKNQKTLDEEMPDY